jgi:hypothetical protein
MRPSTRRTHRVPERVEVRLPFVGVIAATRTWCDKVDAELTALSGLRLIGRGPALADLGTSATANTMKAAPEVEAK